MAEAAKEKVVLEEGAAPEGKSAKGSKTKLIAIIAAVVVLLAGGGAAAYFLVLKPKHDATATEGGAEEAGAEGEAEAKPKGEHGAEKSGEHGEKTAKSEKGEKGGHGEKGAKSASDSNNVPLEPFIVNLNDPSGNRYLKVDMVLEMRGDGCAEAIAGKRERLRDSIILLLRSKTMADLQDVDGVLNLKKEIITRANYEQDTCKALDLLFTDLVIQ